MVISAGDGTAASPGKRSLVVCGTIGELLTGAYAAAIKGANPDAAMAACVEEVFDEMTVAEGRPAVWVLAVGKAALRMLDPAMLALADGGTRASAGLAVDVQKQVTDCPRATSVAGDHPFPMEHSFRAAAEVEKFLEKVKPGDHLLLLLSGGATSLMAAPVAGISERQLTTLFHTLVNSGLDIERVNALRKRFCRLAAGRLPLLAPGAIIHQAILSDVPSDNPEFIGSGPCIADSRRASDLLYLMAQTDLDARTEGVFSRYLVEVSLGRIAETPKPGDPRLKHVRPPHVVGNTGALSAAASFLRQHGCTAEVLPADLGGEAREAGERIARTLIHRAVYGATACCTVLGGETTVSLSSVHGKGGRSQELALAAARVLAEAGDAANGVTLLAAGTDGRDGPTDAAGAVVDRYTWQRIVESGVDPERALREHDAYTALQAAGALLITGPSGTNVMDVLVSCYSSTCQDNLSG